jgi:hypothetical protein
MRVSHPILGHQLMDVGHAPLLAGWVYNPPSSTLPTVALATLAPPPIAQPACATHVLQGVQLDCCNGHVTGHDGAVEVPAPAASKIRPPPGEGAGKLLCVDATP